MPRYSDPLEIVPQRFILIRPRSRLGSNKEAASREPEIKHGQIRHSQDPLRISAAFTADRRELVITGRVYEMGSVFLPTTTITGNSR